MQVDEFMRFLIQHGHTKEAEAVHQVYRKSMGTQSTNEDFEALSLDCISNTGRETLGHSVYQQETTGIESQKVGSHPWMKETIDDENLRANLAPANSSRAASIIEAIDQMELRIMGIRP